MTRLKRFRHRITAGACCLTLLLTLCLPPAACAPAQAATEDEELDYMKLKNLNGPSGVALGGIGVGYYEIDPTGRIVRNCINNVHLSFADRPAGFTVGAWNGEKAVRLQRDGDTLYGMKGYADSDYTGLWPTVTLEMQNSAAGVADMGYSAYSGLTAHDVKNSSLPAVYYDVELRNDQSSARTMSALLTWGDLIGRGMRDSDKATLSDLNGESADWKWLPTPATYAKGVRVQSGETVYTGVMQYAKAPLEHRRATFQNYNNAFLILAEDTADTDVTILKSFAVNNENALNSYVRSGKLSAYDESETALSPATGGTTATSNGSAVAVSAQVPAGGKATVRLMVCWFAPETTAEDYARQYRFANCNYDKYYHNFFSDVEDLAAYAIGVRETQRAGIAAWQQPILDSSLPDWLQFKQINSGYTLYANGVLNKRGNFSTLEGGMGGYGGTMDQKMNSYPVYEKLFPSLNLTENRQYANVTGSSGEIQHFDVHYYYGMADYEDKANPTPAGSMIDNTGAWMMQMWNHYRQTGSDEYLRAYYGVMKQSMKFLRGKCPSGTHIPSYNTTYDDFSHPQMFIFSGTVWLYMLDIGRRWALVMDDAATAKSYTDLRELAAAEVALYYGDWSADLGVGSYYAYGSNREFLTSGGTGGSAETAIMFSGAMAGQFMSRLNGLGDVIPFDTYDAHTRTLLETSVQDSPDYMAPKVYNVRTGQGQDWLSSGCWPFYLESYGGMAAIQAGRLEDGLEILEHTSLADLRLGYTWTRSLWSRAYLTYMTAPVSWMIGDVLAGASVDAASHTLTLGPSCPASTGVGVGDRLQVTLYYPAYWATVTYAPKQKTFTYEIVKTFYEEGDDPLTITQVVAMPAGKAATEAVTIPLNTAFTVTEGAVLDLSAHLNRFAGVTHEKTLTPVGPYEAPRPEKLANGTGLTSRVTVDGQTVVGGTVESVDLHYTADAPPAEGIIGEYTMELQGQLMPRYSQKYQILLEYTGSPDDLTVYFDGEEATDFGSRLEDVESQQFTPTAGCGLRVFTRALDAGALVPIRIVWKGNVSRGENVLRLMWWSSTQQMGLIIKERMYPARRYDEMIDGTAYTDATCQIEGDHMAYTRPNSYALYSGIQFEEEWYRYTLVLNAGAPNNANSRGGVMEVRLNGPDGPLLGTLNFTPTGGWSTYRPQTVTLSRPLSGLCDVCLVFRPSSDFLFNYTTFTFRRSDQPVDRNEIAAIQADEAIGALPDRIARKDAAAVQKARAVYDALSPEAQALVEGAPRLELAEALLELAMADWWGDINDDGAVNAADALLALQHSVKFRELTGIDFTLADVDGNATVNAADALLILQKSVRLIDYFPVE